MRNVFLQKIGETRYAEITKPLYEEIQNIPLGIVNCGSAKIFESYSSLKWKHRGFVFMFITDGDCEAKIEGKTYHLSKGNVFCYRTANTNSVFTPKTKTFSYKWIDIYGTAASFYYHLINETNFPYISIHSCSTDKLLYHFDRIQRNLMLESKQACYKNISILTELLTDIITEQKTQKSQETDRYAKSFAALFEYVEKNYFNSISVDQMASVFGISKYYFIRLFQEFVGISPMKYVRNFRIGKSTELLVQSDRSIEEISDIIGYKTPSQFISNFRDVMNITPLQYRKNHKKVINRKDKIPHVK